MVDFKQFSTHCKQAAAIHSTIALVLLLPAILNEKINRLIVVGFFEELELNETVCIFISNSKNSTCQSGWKEPMLGNFILYVIEFQFLTSFIIANFAFMTLAHLELRKMLIPKLKNWFFLQHFIDSSLTVMEQLSTYGYYSILFIIIIYENDYLYRWPQLNSIYPLLMQIGCLTFVVSLHLTLQGINDPYFTFADVKKEQKEEVGPKKRYLMPRTRYRLRNRRV